MAQLKNNNSGQPNSGALRSALHQAFVWDMLGLPAFIILTVYGLTTLTFFVFSLWLQQSTLEEPAATLLGGGIGSILWLVFFFRRVWLILVINQEACGEPVHLLTSLATTLRRLPVVLLCFGLMALPVFITSGILSLSPCLSILMILPTVLWIPVLYIAQALLLAGGSLWRVPITAIRHLFTNWRQGLALGLLAIPVSLALGNWQHKLIILEEYSYAPIAIVLRGVVLGFLEAFWYGLIARYTAYALQDANPLHSQRFGWRWSPLRSLAAALVAGVVILAVAFTPPFHIFYRAIGVGTFTQGGVWYDEGNYIAAIDAYQHATDAYQSAADPIGQAAAHSKLSDSHLALGHYDEAIRHNLAAQALFSSNPNEPIALSLKANLGIIYRKQGRYTEAQALYEEVLPEVRASDDEALLSSLLIDIFTVKFLQGQYDEAHRSLSEALPLLRQQGNQEAVARALANLSSADVHLGQFFQAIKDAEEALDIYEQEQIYDPAYEAVARLSLAGAYHRIGDPLRARDYGETALELSRAANDPANEGRALSELSAIAFTLKRYDEALDYIEQSVTISQHQNDRSALSIRLNSEALILLRLGRPAEAENLLTLALDIARTEGFRRGEALALDGLGNAYMMLDRIEDAINSYQAALAIEREIRDQLLEVNTLADLGGAYLLAGRRVEALQELETAADMLEKLRTDLRMPDLRASFLSDWQDIYLLLVTLLVEDGEAVRAFNYSERARARAFLDQLVSGPVDFRPGANAQLLEKERTLRNEIAALRAQLVTLRNRPVTEWDTGTIADAQGRLTALEADYEAILVELKLQSPEIADALSVDVASLTDIQGLLDSDTTLVEYFVTQERTLAFIITRNTFEAVVLDVGRENLAEAITDFRTVDLDFAALSESDPYPSSLQQLHKWLIVPLEPHLSTPTLGIVPHGVLHYLPFAALTDGKRYLSDDYVLFTLPSASALRFLQEKRKPEADTLLALGNPTTAEPLRPLPFAEQEVVVIAELYGTQPLLSERATESAVWLGADETGLLHLAAHGEYNRFNPLFSAIHLAGDNQHDGRLEVYEVYGLDLTAATDLVVLSACQTQLGKLDVDGEPVGVSSGDEVVGLNRAFLYAGTPSVMASLWSVDDAATALLMEHFYIHLRAGMSKAKALRQAQINVRTEYPHPYYWSPFVLTGDAGVAQGSR